MMELKKSKLKPELKVACPAADLKTVDKNIIIEKLEENIRLREMPIEKQAKKGLLK
jgi:hypothetical protein